MEGAFLVAAVFFAGSASAAGTALSFDSAFFAEDAAFVDSVFFLDVFFLSAFFAGALLTGLAAFFITAGLSFVASPSCSAVVSVSASASAAAAACADDDCSAAAESPPPGEGGLEDGGGLDGGDAAGGGGGGSSEPPNFPSTAPTAIFNRMKTEFRMRNIQPNRLMIPL